MPDPKFAKPWHGVAREEIPWWPTVNEDACIGCGTCVVSCGRQVYRFDFESKKAVVADPMNCMVGRTTCSVSCPTSAISFPAPDLVLSLEDRPEVRHAIEEELLSRREELAFGDLLPSPDHLIQMEIRSIVDVSEGTRLLRLVPHRDEDCMCQFAPGQYLEIWIPGTEWMSRAYSIGNAPHEDGSVELHFRRVEGGRVSEWLFGRAAVGDVITVRGPVGAFTLRSAGDRPLAFVARGTGFAPIKAIIEQQLQMFPLRQMVLFWGVTTSEDLYALESLEGWLRQDPNLRITLVARRFDGFQGHRSATGSRAAGLGVGYELHTAVLARDAGWSNGIDRLNLGPDVPPVITTISLVPAGSRRDDAIVAKLIAAKADGFDIDDVVWDRGYSQLRPENTNHPLNRAGIQTTFRPKDTQRAARPFSADALLIEGHLISSHVPIELRRLLPMPPMKSSAEESARYEEVFNLLAQYRFERNGKPDADGATRWRCPVCAGRLRSRQVPKSMRGPRNRPLVALPEGATCCNGTVTASAAELPHWQRFLPGTTAWRISYGRHQVVEGVNAMLKGGFVNIQHKFFRVFGLAKMTLLLAFTLAGYNLEAIRSFTAKKEAERTAPPPKRTRKKRRTGRWTDVIGSDRPESGRSPPPT